MFCFGGGKSVHTNDIKNKTPNIDRYQDQCDSDGEARTEHESDKGSKATASCAEPR